MHITLHPVRKDGATLSVVKQGDTLIINEQVLDFAQMPDGATIPLQAIACDFIASGVERINGVLHITLLLPHGADASEAVRFPAPIINPPDGPLELPQ